MSFYEGVDMVSTYSGIPLTLAGFWVTFRQAKKAAGAAEAARKASATTRNKIVRSSLIQLSHQLAKIEDELERAASDGDTKGTITWINSWKWHASHTKGLLQSSISNQDKARRALQNSITAASVAKDSLVTGSSDAVTATTGLRSSIGKVTAEVSSLAAGLGVEVEDES